MAGDPLIRNISDTALWVAHYRAQETERPDALFRDPLARMLAGERGAAIAKAQTFSDRNAWSFTARTVVFDRFIQDNVRAGADLVVNLAAGLDTRPYRMDLPRTLRWVEVDLPGIVDYKENVLRGAAPVCVLERVRLDLSDRPGRQALLARLGGSSSRAVVVCEGLLIYLDPDEVRTLSADIAAQPGLRTWIVDLTSPGLMKTLNRKGGAMIAAAGAPFKFAPPEGPAFFTSLGWSVTRIESLLLTAHKLKRLPFLLDLIARLAGDAVPKNMNRPWGGVLQLDR